MIDVNLDYDSPAGPSRYPTILVMPLVKPLTSCSVTQPCPLPSCLLFFL